MSAIKNIAEANEVAPDICQGCGELEPSCGLERAHVITRDDGGLDVPCNIWILCRNCHRGSRSRGWPAQPQFAPGDEDVAEAWLARHPSWLEGWAKVLETATTFSPQAIDSYLAGGITHEQLRDELLFNLYQDMRAHLLAG